MNRLLLLTSSVDSSRVALWHSICTVCGSNLWSEYYYVEVRNEGVYRPFWTGKYRIVHFREEGSAKQPHVPYDTIKIEVELTKSADEASESPASA